MLDRILVFCVRLLIGTVRALPLQSAARLGRFLGGVTYFLDWRHRKVARLNLTAVFGCEKSPAEIRNLAHENFRRIGESFVCGMCTAGMAPAEVDERLEVEGGEGMAIDGSCSKPSGRIMVLGHFGNFEIFATVAHKLPGYTLATTYRAFRPPALNNLLLSYRERRDCLFLERTRDARRLMRLLKQGGLILGLLSDQHGGSRGVKGPFLGIECSTTAAPAVFARRFGYPLHTATCFRTGLARWKIEISEAIPVSVDGELRSVEAITADFNRIFESAVRKDPANWFWVHNRWRLAETASQSVSG